MSSHSSSELQQQLCSNSQQQSSIQHNSTALEPPKTYLKQYLKPASFISSRVIYDGSHRRRSASSMGQCQQSSTMTIENATRSISTTIRAAAATQDYLQPLQLAPINILFSDSLSIEPSLSCYQTSSRYESDVNASSRFAVKSALAKRQRIQALRQSLKSANENTSTAQSGLFPLKNLDKVDSRNSQRNEEKNQPLPLSLTSMNALQSKWLPVHQKQFDLNAALLYPKDVSQQQYAGIGKNPTTKLKNMSFMRQHRRISIANESYNAHNSQQQQQLQPSVEMSSNLTSLFNSIHQLHNSDITTINLAAKKENMIEYSPPITDRNNQSYCSGKNNTIYASKKVNYIQYNQHILR